MNAALTGSLLFALWSDVAVVAAVFAPLGVLQWVFRRRFVALSWGAHGQRRSDWSSTRWDFVFYALFALAITVSVQAVGVLLVFSFLIVPGVLTQLFSRDLGARLLAGWGVAAAASLAGLTASWTLDLPAGPSIVVAFGALLVVAALVAVVRPRRA